MECRSQIRRQRATWGQNTGYVDAAGVPRVGRVDELASLNDRIAYFVKDETSGQRVLMQGRLDPVEAAAAKKYGDALFGKPQGPRRDLGGDLFAIYDRMLEIFGSNDREALLRQVPNHPKIAAFELLSVEQLRVRVAREMATLIYAQSAKTPNEPPEDI